MIHSILNETKTEWTEHTHGWKHKFDHDIFARVDFGLVLFSSLFFFLLFFVVHSFYLHNFQFLVIFIFCSRVDDAINSIVHYILHMGRLVWSLGKKYIYIYHKRNTHALQLSKLFKKPPTKMKKKKLYKFNIANHSNLFNYFEAGQTLSELINCDLFIIFFTRYHVAV